MTAGQAEDPRLDSQLAGVPRVFRPGRNLFILPRQ